MPQQEATRISKNPLDDVQVGDFFWVKFEDTKWDDEGQNKIKIGEHETLMCVEEIGSNYFGFTIYNGRHSSDVRVHFNDFMQECRPEPNWRQILNDRMDEARKAIQEKTKQLIREGQKLCLLPSAVKEPTDQPMSLLPARVFVDPKQHKKELIKLQKKLPEISKEIEALGEDFAVAARNLALPDLVKLGAIRSALSVVEDRIFTIELYCGILEEVEKIADGEPAPIGTPIVIRQQMLYMDEETLFDYNDGGMDFKKIGQFDEWVVKPENLNRILPDQRGLVAFRVRRDPKEYGDARNLGEAWAHMQWKQANEQTYLLIRNGGNVYRIASEVDFSPRLIPKIDEIGKDQFTKIDEKYVWKEDPPEEKFGVGGTYETVKTEVLVTPDSVEFDDHVKKVDKLLKHYNRIVILLQGLLDRSTVFHPHPVINLRNPKDMERWIVLIRDEERGLPSNRVSWEEYQKQLNSSVAKGKWIYVDSNYDEGYANGERPYRESGRYQTPRRRGWAANRMPDICKIDSVKRDGSAVQVSWPWGQLAHGKERWVESKTRPGWGHYEYDRDTERMCHEWVPVTRILNLSDYTPGDYKMFLCDRSLQGKYLKWAQYLLTAEDWSRNRAKGIPPEDEPKAQTRN